MTIGRVMHRIGEDLHVPSRRVVVVTFPSAQMLDIAGPIEVFGTASELDEAASYRTTLVSASGGAISTTAGVQFETSPIAQVRGPIDTLLVAGGEGKLAAAMDDHLLEHLRRLASKSRRVTSVCTGAFVLAAAGLLDGRQATTHWRWCERLADMYPDVRVDRDAIYVRHGDLWTSAGITAGIDMTLALVAEDHGQRLAADIARELVVYLRRAGGQAQFSAPLAAQATEREPLRDLLEWIVQHVGEDLSVGALARRIHLSERQLSRVFKAELGLSPADHVESVRLEAACRLLETTTMPLDQVARQVGWAATETMHRVFRRRLQTTPGDHRRHFHVGT